MELKRARLKDKAAKIKKDQRNKDKLENKESLTIRKMVKKRCWNTLDDNKNSRTKIEKKKIVLDTNKDALEKIADSR